MINAIGTYIGSRFPGGLDPDAVAFFNRVTTAGGALTTTEQVAVNTLVIQMKTYGIWSKMKAIYPMVGASAAACSRNLKSDNFNGTFTSGWTIDSGGVQGNGTAYMDTKFTPSLHYANSSNFGLFLYTSSTTAGLLDRDFAIFQNADVPSLNLTSKDGTSSKTDLFSFVTSRISIGGYAVEGFYIGSRTASNSAKLFRNGIVIGSTAGSSGDAPSIPLFLGKANGVNVGSAKKFSLAGTCDGLTDTEASDFYTAVQAFQTTLSRNV